MALVDVIRELHAIARVAEEAEHRGIVDACRRAESLLARLQNQFTFEVAGPGTPSGSRVEAA